MNVEDLTDVIAAAVNKATTSVAAELKKRDARIAALEAEVKELRGRRMEHVGVWQPDVTYEKGDCVTHNGSVWYAREPTTAKPGERDPASRAWRMILRRLA